MSCRSFWEHPTPAAAMLVLRPARRAKSVRWWLGGVASNSCTPSPCPAVYSHKMQAWQNPAEVQRWRFDSRDQNLIGFSAGPNLQSCTFGFSPVFVIERSDKCYFHWVKLLCCSYGTWQLIKMKALRPAGAGEVMENRLAWGGRVETGPCFNGFKNRAD